MARHVPTVATSTGGAVTILLFFSVPTQHTRCIEYIVSCICKRKKKLIRPPPTMDAVIRWEERRHGGSDHVLDRVPIGSTFLDEGSEARVLAEQLHALTLKKIGVKPGEEEMEIDVPPAFSLLSEDALEALLYQVLDVRNLGPLRPMRDAAHPEAYRRRVLGESARLMNTFNSLRTTSRRTRRMVMDRQFRKTLYLRWYRFHSMDIAASLHTVEQARSYGVPEPLVTGLPEPATKKRRVAPEDQPLPPNWYRTLLYDAILGEYLFLSFWSASKIVLSRGGYRLWARAAYTQQDDEVFSDHNLLRPTQVTSKSRLNVNEQMLRALQRAGMLAPGSRSLAFVFNWLLIDTEGAEEFPGIDRLVGAGGLRWSETGEWPYFDLVKRALARSDVWRLPRFTYSNVRGIRQPMVLAAKNTAIHMNGSGHHLLLDNLTLPAPPLEGAPGAAERPVTYRFWPAYLPKMGTARVHIQRIKLMNKAATEDWLSQVMRTSRMIPIQPRRQIRSVFVLSNVYHRKGETGNFLLPPGVHRPQVRDGVFQLALEQGLSVRPERLIRLQRPLVRNTATEPDEEGNWVRIAEVDVYPKISGTDKT